MNGFTPLDDIRNQMDMYGANGLESELLNVEALDESVSNLVCEDYNYGFMGMGMGWADYKGKVKAIVKAPKIVKTDKGYFRQGFFPKGTEKNVVDFQKITFYCPFLKRNVTKVLLVFDDGTASTRGRWDKISKFSGFTNESLLDGLTENTSLLNASGNELKVKNIKDVYILSYNGRNLYETNNYVRKNTIKQVSTNKTLAFKSPNDLREVYLFTDGSYGLVSDWTPIKKIAVKSKNATLKLAYNGRNLYELGTLPKDEIKFVSQILKGIPYKSANDLKNAYKFTDGTYGLVSDWFPTEDKAENQNYSNLTNESLLDGLTENTSLLSANGETETKKEVKILGMTPTTFGMVAGGAILVIGIVTLINRK